MRKILNKKMNKEKKSVISCVPRKSIQTIITQRRDFLNGICLQ